VSEGAQKDSGDDGDDCGGEGCNEGGECGGEGPNRRDRTAGVDISSGVWGDLGRLMFDRRPCRNVPPSSPLTDDLDRSSSTEARRTGGTGAGATSFASCVGLVALLVRGRFNCLACVGGDRAGVLGVLGVAFLLLPLELSSRPLFRLVLLAALSTDDFAALNNVHARSSSGSLIAAGGVTARLD
jgi:hypothetical protein